MTLMGLCLALQPLLLLLFAPLLHLLRLYLLRFLLLLARIRPLLSLLLHLSLGHATNATHSTTLREIIVSAVLAQEIVRRLTGKIGKTEIGSVLDVASIVLPAAPLVAYANTPTQVAAQWIR